MPMDAIEKKPLNNGSPLRLLLTVTWQEQGEWYLYRRLKERCQNVRVIHARGGAGPGSRLMARLTPVLLALKAFAGRGNVDVVCSWSMPVGVCYGLLNRLLQRRTAPRHILRDLHINMVRTDWRYRLRLAVLRYALPGIDTLLCTSREEESLYARMLGIEPERIAFFPETAPSQFIFAQNAAMPSDYVFACGNSDRDFDTLLAAVDGLGHATIILSQQYRPRRALPAGVQILSHRVSVQKMQGLIQGAAVVVVPLEHTRVAAGQNSLLEAMALGRPVIVTDNFATREYVVHGQTALLCPAGNAAHMSAHLRRIFEDREAAEAMGTRARAAAASMLDEQVRLFFDILHRYGDIQGNTTRI
jgi:glycosyltransferase involved in cell wall biosynthesis